MAAKKKIKSRTKKIARRGNERTVAKTKSSNKKQKTTSRNKRGLVKTEGTKKNVVPTRGRIQLLNLRSMGAPFMDSKGRFLISCEYSDGSTRVYSVDTILKNKEPLIHLLGEASVKRALRK